MGQTQSLPASSPGTDISATDGLRSPGELYLSSEPKAQSAAWADGGDTRSAEGNIYVEHPTSSGFKGIGSRPNSGGSKRKKRAPGVPVSKRPSISSRRSSRLSKHGSIRSLRKGSTAGAAKVSAGGGHRVSHPTTKPRPPPPPPPPPAGARRAAPTDSVTQPQVDKTDSPRDSGATTDKQLPSTELKRLRRLSTATSSSLGVDPQSPPAITVTDCSDADTEPDRISSARNPARRASKTDTSPPGKEFASVSHTSSSISETHRKSGSPVKGKSRRKSGASNISTDSTASSQKSGRKQARKSTEFRIKRGLLGKNDPKFDAANKWKSIVDEFEDVYGEDANKRKPQKDVRRVSKLANLEQYDNVRQVFSRSMPLPMQMAPPGARVEDIEAESASETSSYSWNLMTPMGKASAAAKQQAAQSSSAQAQATIQSASHTVSNAVESSSVSGASPEAGVKATGAAITPDSVQQAKEAMNASSFQAASGSRSASASRVASSSSRGSAFNHAASEMKQSHVAGSRSGSRSASRSASRSGSRAHSAASHSEMQQSVASSKSSARRHTSAHGAMIAAAAPQGNMVTQSITREETREIRQTKGGTAGGRGAVAARAVMAARGNKVEKHAQKSHKGVKFRRVTDIEEQAAILVDDVIQNALWLLYGDRRKVSNQSKTSSHASSQSLSHQSSSSVKKLSHVQKTVERHIEHRKSLGQKQERMAARKEIRSHSLRPIQGSGRQGSTVMRSLQAKPSSQQQQSDMAGLYDMVIQRHGEETKSEAEMEWYRRLNYPPLPSMNSAETNTTTSIHVNHNESNRLPPLPAYQEEETASQSERPGRKGVNPPTITRGTITRVFHELDKQNRIPANTLLQSLRANQSFTAEEPREHSSLDYSCNTWPLNRSQEGFADAGPASFSSTQYLAPEVSDTFGTQWTLPEDPYTIQQNRLPAVSLGSGPGGYVHDNIASSPSYQPPSSDVSYTMANFRSHGSVDPHQRRVDLRTDSGQMIHSLPFMLPSYTVNPLYEGNTSSHSLDPNVLQNSADYSATYSNEPIIVADLLDRVQSSSDSFYSVDNQPRVNMNRNQVLNFYVFNQPKDDEAKPKIRYAAQNIQARVGEQEVQRTDLYLDEEDLRERVIQAVPDPVLPNKKKYTIYHKQTQTLPPPTMTQAPAPGREVTPTPTRKIKKQKVIRRVVPRSPSPERPKSPVVHRETHHYITKERQIEKLPPPPAPMAEFSVQTDMTGQDWEDEVDYLHRALTSAERRANDAERAMEEMHTSNAAIQSVVREIEEVVEEQEHLTSPPPREIPVSLEIVPVESEPKKEIVETEDDEEEEEEEELYEWTEIEEKEQRLSMAIFEEIEFNLQRTQGGVTSTESGKSSEKVPWSFPQKYEAVVDRRKQKLTQVRDVHKEGDDVFLQSGKTPQTLNHYSSLNRILGVDKPDGHGGKSTAGGNVTEQRDMMLKREENIIRPTNEVNIEINRNGEPGMTTNEIHKYALDHHPKGPTRKSNYMSTFERKMDRSKASPPKAKGRTDHRVEKHFPQTGKIKSHSSTFLRDIAGLRIPIETNEKHSTALHHEVGGISESGPNARHSMTILQNVDKSADSVKEGTVQHSERHVTTYEQEPKVAGTNQGQHSVTYIANKGAAPAGGKRTERHISTYTRRVGGKQDEEATHGQSTSNSSGYSSADNTTRMRLQGFEIPFQNHQEEHEENARYYNATEVKLSRPDVKESNSSSTVKRFVSRFDPGNIYFTVPQWTPVESSELLHNMTNEGKANQIIGPIDEHDHDSLPDALPAVEAEHIKRNCLVTKSQNEQLPPKSYSEVVEDEDGNLVKVTTTEQKMVKRVDYVSERESQAPPTRRSDEALVEESFVEVDLTTEHVEGSATRRDEEKETLEEVSGEKQVVRDGGIRAVETVTTVPEVVAETSIGFKRIEYDDQQLQLGLGKEEEQANMEEKQYLYDMRTAMLNPVKIRDDKSGELLVQYSLGDTMVTEL